MTILTNERKLGRILKLTSEVKSSLKQPNKFICQSHDHKTFAERLLVCRCSNTCYSFNRFLSCCIHTQVRLLTYLPQGEIKLSQQQIMASLNVSNVDSIHLYCMIFICSIKCFTFVVLCSICIV